MHKQNMTQKVVGLRQFIRLAYHWRNSLQSATPVAKWRICVPHNGDWLHTTPICACGLQDNAICVAVGLCLGSAICEAHTCPCGATVDSLGQHALSCTKHPGKVQRHARINDLVHRALIRADMPATKEPLDLSRKDGTRMWANAQRDGRPDEHRWSPLFNAAKFG